MGFLDYFFQSIAILVAGSVVAFFSYRLNGKLLDKSKEREIALKVVDKIERLSGCLRESNVKYWLKNSDNYPYLTNEIAVYTNVYARIIGTYLPDDTVKKFMNVMTAGDFGKKDRPADPNRLYEILALLYHIEFCLLEKIHKTQ